MNQSILLNDDLTYNSELTCWQLTGFYQSQTVVIYFSTARLAPDAVITDEVIFELEADIEDWLADNEPDEDNIIRL